jgi:uncharacterized protein (DUF3820 family)
MTRMPFGKHTGVELEKVPRQYLLWLRRQPQLGAWLAKEIDLVLSGEAETLSEESFEEVLGKWKLDENQARSREAGK